MIIQYYKKSVYGVVRIYIKDKDVALTISNLTNKKTLDQSDLNRFMKLGVEFKQELPPE